MAYGCTLGIDCGGVSLPLTTNSPHREGHLLMTVMQWLEIGFRCMGLCRLYWRCQARSGKKKQTTRKGERSLATDGNSLRFYIQQPQETGFIPARRLDSRRTATELHYEDENDGNGDLGYDST